MLVFKIVFWMMVVSCFIRMIDCTQDHPRTEQPVNLGTDLIVFLVRTGLCIWLGISIFR